MEGRIWRTFAQRNVRNAWSSIAALRSDWKSSSSRGLAAATALVNALLTRRYVCTMNIGVLHEMQDIRERAEEKLARQQLVQLEAFLEAYEHLVIVTSKLIQQASSMRVYARDPSGSPVAAFSNKKVLEDDAGDGQGLPVFSVLPVKFFEGLAEEIVNMYRLELNNKWLLASELNSVAHNKRRCLPLDGFPGLESTVLHKNFLDKGTEQGDTEREVLEVYLACWLTEVNVNNQRIDEILFLVGEEMQVQLL